MLALELVLVLVLELALVLELELEPVLELELVLRWLGHNDVVAVGKSNDYLMWWQGASQMTD